MHIHIEGLDLAGKSTVCRRLKERLSGATIRHNSLVESNFLYEQADTLRLAAKTDDNLLGMLYYEALRIDLDSYYPQQNDVIQDSTILLRSFVFHTTTGNTELANLYQALLPVCPRFDSSFVLMSSREKRLERLKGRISRGNDAPDDLVVRDDWERFTAMEKLLIESAQQYFNATIIQTDNLESPEGSEAVLNQIIETVQHNTQNPIHSDLWQRASLLAGRCHRYQLRKDKQTPYITHPLRVALTLSNLFHVSDPIVLAASLLHDVLEDTDGDYDDIEETCGSEVAELVAGLTKDSRLQEAQRDEEYQNRMVNADWRVRLIKAADIYDNLWDMKNTGVKVNSKRWADWLLKVVADDRRFDVAAGYVKRMLED
jgi:thymidylate kinase